MECASPSCDIINDSRGVSCVQFSFFFSSLFSVWCLTVGCKILFLYPYVGNFTRRQHDEAKKKKKKNEFNVFVRHVCFSKIPTLDPWNFQPNKITIKLGEKFLPTAACIKKRDKDAGAQRIISWFIGGCDLDHPSVEGEKYATSAGGRDRMWHSGNKIRGDRWKFESLGYVIDTMRLEISPTIVHD